jgi:hypothetical protein
MEGSEDRTGIGSGEKIEWIQGLDEPRGWRTGVLGQSESESYTLEFRIMVKPSLG